MVPRTFEIRKAKYSVRMRENADQNNAEYGYFLRSVSLCLQSKNILTPFYLKLASAIFYQIFIFSPNDCPSKTGKNVFYFISKALFVLEIFKFWYFFLFPSTFSRLKRTNGSGIINVCIGLHKFEDIIFGIIQKPLHFTPSNLVR